MAKAKQTPKTPRAEVPKQFAAYPAHQQKFSEFIGRQIDLFNRQLMEGLEEPAHSQVRCDKCGLLISIGRRKPPQRRFYRYPHRSSPRR